MKCLCVMIDCDHFTVQCFHTAVCISNISENKNPDKENTNQNAGNTAECRRHNDSPQKAQVLFPIIQDIRSKINRKEMMPYEVHAA